MRRRTKAGLRGREKGKETVLEWDANGQLEGGANIDFGKGTTGMVEVKPKFGEKGGGMLRTEVKKKKGEQGL